MAALVSLYRGDSLTLRVSILDINGTPVNTTGWTIEFTARRQDVSPVSTIYKTSATPGEVDPVDEPNGVWDVKLSASDTNIAIGRHVFDVQATDPAGRVYTVLKDDIRVLQDVTRP